MANKVKSSDMRAIFIFLMMAAAALAEERLPDGEVTSFGNLKAYLIEPTSRYAHGALGDTIEAAGFAVERNGKIAKFILDKNHVFEDRRVRLHDIDGDQKLEAIIIRSHLREGAAIAVYDISGNTITLKAESENIGTANRWLNIVGVADFTGSGETMIAAVITPHLAGSLRLYRLQGKALQEVARIDGYTNHINGTRELDLAKLEDKNRDGVVDITLPKIDSSGEATITFRNGKAKILQ